ncbi:3-ketoacyl-ACP reductase [Sphaerisporangium rufum]|uniref:3-ketoacyl-ACP reductase n=1 Tax=Sphaerisporangium rufum TaxID=1381558 RepID=A0A919R8S4_9ACTN|nr:SDR family oxidoreductase [Sphaerisporangium rufum]GII81308.1 3-ketoacyl-ACP reductase [Sphaerisporangium rufum]
MSDLTGKVAFVTGGARGIGAAIVRRLVQGGADVAFTYLSSGDQARALADDLGATGRRVIALRADGNRGEEMRAALDETVARLGRLDVLVNNAGVWTSSPVEKVNAAEFDAVMGLHVRTAFLLAQAAAERMDEGGRIISIGSNLAVRVGRPGITLYAMSKSALAGMTQGLAHDLAPRGITVNLVHPGSTDTDMNPADGPFAAEQRAGIPLGRFADPDDVAATVAHLAGEGGRAITGTAISVDGGVNA